MKIEKKRITSHGNTYEYAMKGHQGPAIILINGAGGPIEAWLKIWWKFDRDRAVFAYNRLGVGKSTKPKEPQTGIKMVMALKALLVDLKLEPPYLIVGHSFGGFIAHLYAATYPDDVAGLLFLESSTIEDVVRDSKHKKQAKPYRYSEVDHVSTTVKQIQAIDQFPNLPIRVIIGGKPALSWIIPKAKKAARIDNQRALMHLSEYGRLTVAKNSGHFPQITEAQLVINEVNGLFVEIANRVQNTTRVI